MSRMDLPAFESLRGEFAISTNRDALDLDVIHNSLADSYWAAGIPRDVVARSIQNSLCFGIYQQQQQVGFARVISDFATYAYIADVFVVDGFRGRGLGKWLMECIMAYPQLQHLRRWGLATRDAHGLYQQFGFSALASPGRHMERYNQNVYRRLQAE
jgi:GNAT superfamily N-acetyltransferase